jgi:CheY-like chemotaxis protein
MTKLNFLVADDYIDNRILLKEIINILGHNCILAEDGEQACEMLKINAVDIILMDIEMPRLNGLEATHEIRAHFSSPKNQTPIIAISAHSPEHFNAKLKKTGFNDYISKPYSIEKIIDIIERYKK